MRFKFTSQVEIVRTSICSVVGGENSPPIEKEIYYCLINAYEKALVIVITCVVDDPLQVIAALVLIDIFLQINAPLMGIRLPEISRVQVSLVGNFIVIIPSIGILFRFIIVNTILLYLSTSLLSKCM